MQAVQKEMRDKVKAANDKRGVLIYLFGNGKGKSSSAFGTLMRSVGHGQQTAVVQFIKGNWKTGEEVYFNQETLIKHDAMKSGFTWDTQDKNADKLMAQETWAQAEKHLSDPALNLVVIDELTYMFDYDYLSLTECLKAIQSRPAHQSVIITGRSRIEPIVEIADTVSEVVEHKHAFNEGVKAQPGIEF